MAPGHCVHHEAVEARLDAGEKDHTDLWCSINEIRKDIKGIIWKIGFIVGIISALNSLVVVFLR